MRACTGWDRTEIGHAWVGIEKGEGVHGLG